MKTQENKITVDDLIKFHTSLWEDKRQNEYGIQRFWCSTESEKFKLSLYDLILKEIIGNEQDIIEGKVMATPFNAIILGKNELKREQRQALTKLFWGKEGKK